MNFISDEELARSFGAGTEEHFEVLIDRYETKVFRLAARLVGSESEAESVLQAVFLDAFEQFRRKVPSSVQNWFYRAALNAAMKRLQERLESEKKSNEAPQEESPTVLPESLAPQQTPSAAIDFAPVEKAIKKLPQEYREVFCLHDIHGVEDSQIAEITVRKIEEVVKLLHRARLMVRRTMVRVVESGERSELSVATESFSDDPRVLV